jgi:hypothetical protein
MYLFEPSGERCSPGIAKAPKQTSEQAGACHPGLSSYRQQDEDVGGGVRSIRQGSELGCIHRRTVEPRDTQVAIYDPSLLGAHQRVHRLSRSNAPQLRNMRNVKQGTLVKPLNNARDKYCYTQNGTVRAP